MKNETELETAGYTWTKHALVDMGIASLLAFAEREKPENLTQDDLEEFARYAEQAYFAPELSSYLTVLFTSNFINPSFSPDRKKEFVREIVRAHRSPQDPDLAPCVYCDRPSVRLAHRDLVPMLTGREQVNFYPGGAPGIALCGHCMIALQALSIGTPMCSGRALVVACDDPRLTLELVRAWQPEIRKRIQLSQQSGQKLAPITRPLTRTIEALLKIEAERLDDTGESDSSITVYHLSNSGQGPQADIFFLPSSVVRFVRRANQARYARTWAELVRLAWESPPKPKKSETAKEVARTSLRNYLYEDLFNLPDRVSRFVRIYFVRKAVQRAQGPGDPRSSYRGWKDYIVGLWDLTSLFLKEVMVMDTRRIEAIRKLADTLAEEIANEEGKHLWWAVYRITGRDYRSARRVLIRTSWSRLKRGLSPLLSSDEFLEIFEEGEELARADWLLAWDLMLIRILEKLNEIKWIEKNRDVLEEAEKEPEMEEA